MTMTRREFARRQNELFENDPFIEFAGSHILYDNVIMNESCKIKAGAVIGFEGFGFERDENGVPFRIPHIGKVVLGYDVEIGANTVIARGTVDDTVIGNNVKIDDCCFIAHNCNIGENTLIVAGSVICGSVKIGKNCFIGANCTIKNKVTIGDFVTVGMGANVVKDVPDGATIAGFKAQPFETMKRVARIIERSQ